MGPIADIIIVGNGAACGGWRKYTLIQHQQLLLQPQAAAVVSSFSSTNHKCSIIVDESRVAGVGLELLLVVGGMVLVLVDIHRQ